MSQVLVSHAGAPVRPPRSSPRSRARAARPEPRRSTRPVAVLRRPTTISYSTGGVRVPEARTSSEPTPEREGRPQGAELLRVVLVDDTPDLRELLRMALERTGDFDVVAEAGDGRDAIEVVRQHRPDVVLLDIAMPVMDGLEALPRVREECPEATVVMLSGFSAADMMSRAMSAGAHGYLQKGQSLRSLVAQLHDLVDASATG